MPTVEFNNREPALEYIRKRGYASYSSIRNVRDAIIPMVVSAVYFIFGKELHSRFLENKKLVKLTTDEEEMISTMTDRLNAHAVVKRLMAKVRCEVKFHQLLLGVMVLGYIDILGDTYVADLKTTRCTTMKQFVESMDFLQAAIYLAVTGKKDFYYIGISKQAPYNVMVFNVRDYPARLFLAQCEMRFWLAYIRVSLKVKKEVRTNVWI